MPVSPVTLSPLVPQPTQPWVTRPSVSTSSMPPALTQFAVNTRPGGLDSGAAQLHAGRTTPGLPTAAASRHLPSDLAPPQPLVMHGLNLPHAGDPGTASPTVSSPPVANLSAGEAASSAGSSAAVTKAPGSSKSGSAAAKPNSSESKPASSSGAVAPPAQPVPSSSSSQQPVSQASQTNASASTQPSSNGPAVSPEVSLSTAKPDGANPPATAANAATAPDRAAQSQEDAARQQQQQAAASMGWLSKLPQPLVHLLKRTLPGADNRAWVDKSMLDVSHQSQEISSQFDQWQENFLDWSEIVPNKIQNVVLRPVTQTHQEISQRNQKDLTAMSTLNPMSYLMNGMVKEQIVGHILTRQQAQIDALVAAQNAEQKKVTYLF